MSKAPASATATGLPAYTLDDAANDVGHLAVLLDAIVEIAVGLPRGTEQDTDLARLDAFAWIGRDRAQTIAGDLANMQKGVRS